MGIDAYALYTNECVRIMGLADPAGAGLIEHRETYDLGEVSGWVRDLEAVWRDAEASAALVVGAEQAAWTMSFTFEAPPAIVWEWITFPARRLQWQIGVDALSEDVAPGVARGRDDEDRCVHGRDAIVEEVLAWHPAEVLTTRFQMPMPGVPKLTRSELFEATPDGAKTLFTVRVQRPSSAKDRAKLAEVKSFLFHAYGDGLALLAPMIEADVAARSDPVVSEPELPVSSGRHLTART